MPRRPVISVRAARAGMIVGGALAVMNALSFVFTILAANRLGPTAYGEFAALMALVLVVNVVSMGVQAATARRIASSPSRRAATVANSRRLSFIVGGGTAFLCLALTPVLHHLLGTSDWIGLALIAPVAIVLTVLGSELGIMQGTESWGGFALTYAAFGIGRIICGGAAVFISPTATGALAGVGLGLLLTVFGGAVLARHSVPEPTGGSTPRGIRSLAQESASATSMLLAFVALSNLDVLLAQARLPSGDAGQYAAGTILSKAVLFLPYFVSVVAYPVLARRYSSHIHRWALLAVMAPSAVVAAGAAMLPGLVVGAIGADDYAAVGPRLWQFAVLGGALAGVQLLVTTALARRHTRATWLIWVAVGAMACGGLIANTWAGLLWLTVGVDSVLLLLLTAMTWRDRLTVNDVT